MQDSDWRAWVPQPQGEPFVLARELPPFPGLWDLAASPRVVPHWTAIFRGNGAYLQELVAAEGDAREQAAARRVFEIFAGLLEDLDGGRAFDRVRTIHAVTLIREHLLRAHGIPDPYRHVKAREAERWIGEGERALARAAAWGRREPAGADARGGEAGARADADAGERECVILGDLLAGNLFDLGSRSTQQAFRAGTLDPAAARQRFRETARAALATLDDELRALLRPRPRPLDGHGDGCLVLLADNAGADFLIGVLPAALYFAQRFEVLLVTNSGAASNDITLEEAHALCARLAGRVPDLAAALDAGRLRLLGSGTGSPGIDLACVGGEFNRAAEGARWLLLEGQGRAVETNWTTRFVCPALRVAVVKDPLVAGTIGVAAGEGLLRGA